MNQKFLLFGVLIAIVVASGCIDDPEEENGDVSFTQTAGVEFSNFEITPEQVPDTQNPSMIVGLENAGEAEAQNVEVEIFNVNFGNREDRQWEGTEQLGFRDLRPAEPDQNLEGGSQDRQEVLTPPDLQPDETEIPYTFGARLNYDYSTTSTSEIVFMSQDRWFEENIERQEPDIQNSAAPVQLDVSTSTPFVFGEDHQIQVDVENVGEGRPVHEGEQDTVLLDVRATGDVELQPREGELPVEVDTSLQDQGTVHFTVDPLFDTDQESQRTVPITLDAEYTYEKEETTEVRVSGR